VWSVLGFAALGAGSGEAREAGGSSGAGGGLSIRAAMVAAADGRAPVGENDRMDTFFPWGR
jgi:hypothetical protein